MKTINQEHTALLKSAILKLMKDMRSFQAKYPKAELPNRLMTLF